MLTSLFMMFIYLYINMQLNNYSLKCISFYLYLNFIIKIYSSPYQFIFHRVECFLFIVSYNKAPNSQLYCTSCRFPTQSAPNKIFLSPNGFKRFYFGLEYNHRCALINLKSISFLRTFLTFYFNMDSTS